jgi:tetratricopeptide (TPR) repeat protein
MTDESYRGPDGTTDGPLRRSRGRGGRERPRGIDTYLLYAVLVALAAVLVLVVWMLYAGLLRPQAPRTSIERDIYATEAATKSDPKSQRAWTGYVRALVAAGRYGDANAAVNRARAAVGDLPAFAVASGRISLATGDTRKALDLAAAAIKSALKLRKARTDENAAKGITVDPRTYYGEELVDAYILQADAYEAQAQLAQAVASLGKAIEESPQMADVLVLRGDLYSRLKQYDKARADYEGALKYGPDFAPALSGLRRLQEGASE